MARWLASVQSLDEAKALEHLLPDILDLKNPSEGALGALSVDTVADVVRWVTGRCETSATTGDLPMQASIIVDAAMEMAATDVDYVKVGLFQSETLMTCLEELSHHLPKIGKPVIAVIFADETQDLTLIPAIKKAGFRGVMVDTASKDGQGLLAHWSLNHCRQFVGAGRAANLLCGLAGALRVGDIDTLKTLNAHYLGFRSALCDAHLRTDQLNPALVREIKQHFRPISLAS